MGRKPVFFLPPATAEKHLKLIQKKSSYSWKLWKSECCWNDRKRDPMGVFLSQRDCLLKSAQQICTECLLGACDCKGHYTVGSRRVTRSSVFVLLNIRHRSCRAPLDSSQLDASPAHFNCAHPPYSVSPPYGPDLLSWLFNLWYLTHFQVPASLSFCSSVLVLSSPLVNLWPLRYLCLVTHSALGATGLTVQSRAVQQDFLWGCTGSVWALPNQVTASTEALEMRLERLRTWTFNFISF